MVEGGRRFFYTPELIRISGVVAGKEGSTPKVVETCRRALDLARQQNASILALRAATTLARVDPAHRAELEKALDDMEEGLDTADVQEARGVLAGL